MKLHKLKTLQPFFEDVFNNIKEFEVRKNDRDFEVGDRLQLIEHGDDIKNPRYVLKDIKYILFGGQYGISEGYVVLGLKEIDMRFPKTLTMNNAVKAERVMEKLIGKRNASGCL